MRIYYKIVISRLGVVTFFTKRCNNKKLQSDKHKFSHSVESFDKYAINLLYCDTVQRKSCPIAQGSWILLSG